MPSNRQYRVIAFVAILTVLVVYYVANGARSTHDSPFYRSTLEAIENRKLAEAREDVIQEEQLRLERVERLRKEHEYATSMNPDVGATHPTAAAAAGQAGTPLGTTRERPDYGIEDIVIPDLEKSVAGRKKMKDDKVVHGRPGNDAADGVAKVGNVHPKATADAVAKPVTQEQVQNLEVEATLDEFLKKGPIIIFSKSYCPFSKKAKHILLDLYQISPRPYVVELDKQALGSDLQDALERLTGRHTVPNVLINGKSIGGGDDVEALHTSGKLIETVQMMGGKRIVSIVPAEEAQ